MGLTSPTHLLLILLVVVLLFGRGRLSGLMGDVAEGIKSFKKGMAEDETPAGGGPAAPQPPTALPPQQPPRPDDVRVIDATPTPRDPNA